VLQASAATDKILGVTTEIQSVAGDICDVQVDGIVFIRAGGTIAAGDFLTSDASGNAVVAAPSVGVNNRIAAQALDAAVAGDIFRAAVRLMTYQG
jgi:hypothetical protein